MKSKNQLTSGVVLSYVSQGTQIIVTLFYTPIMLLLLGQSEYGIYQLGYSIVSYLSLFTFGFSSAYVKFYSNCLKEKDQELAIAKINGMFLSIFTILGIIVLFVGFFLTINTEMILGGNLTLEELYISKRLLAIMVINCAINFPTIVFTNYIIAKERFICLQLINILSIILNPCMTFPMLLLGYKSTALAFTMLLISLIKFIFSILYCFKKLKMRFVFKNMKISLLKDISSFSFYIFIESIVTLINISLDRVLLGKMVGSISVAIYAVGGQINTLYTSLSTAISSVFTPKINKMIVNECDDSDLSNLFIKVGKIQFSILLLILSGFLIFGKRFMIMWAGNDYIESYYVAIILIFPNTINLIENIAIEIQRAKNLQKYRSYTYFVIALFNIIISIVLIRKWGACGAALGTCITWIIGSGFVMNWFYYKYVGLNIKQFWKEIIIMIRSVFFPILFFLCIQSYILNCSIVVYLIFILIYSIAYVVFMFCFGFNKENRKMLIDILRKKFVRCQDE